MYANNQGVQKNYTEAAKWYRLAADQGNVRAQFVLGGMYALAQGVPQDNVQAYMWVSLAAAQDNPDGQNATKLLDIIAKGMAPAQIAEAQKLAREWKTKSEMSVDGGTR
jgi:uncharacterized protein